MPLKYETKIIRPDAFFIEKLKLSENDPITPFCRHKSMGMGLVVAN